MKTTASIGLIIILLAALVQPAIAQDPTRPPIFTPLFNVAKIRGEEVLLQFTQWVPGEESFTYTVEIPYQEMVQQNYTVKIPIAGKPGEFREEDKTRNTPVTRMRRETRTGKVPVPQTSIDRYPIASAKFLKINGEDSGLTYLSTKEAKALLASSQPAIVLVYPDAEKQHLGAKYQGEPDLDPYFVQIAEKGTLVIKIKLPDPPQNSGEEEE